MKIIDSFGQSVDIIIPKNTNKLGISMSGGADSSLLCYIVADYLKKTNNSSITIHPITCNWETRPWSQHTVKTVVKKIEGLTRFTNWGQHYVFNVNQADMISDERKQQMFKYYMGFIFQNNLIDHLFSGKTKNPPKEVMDTFIDQVYQVERNNPTKKSIYKAPVETVPFAMVDKRFVIDQYKSYNILEELLPLTRSCEGDINITENFTKECGVCWWCNERKWALEQING